MYIKAGFLIILFVLQFLCFVSDAQNLCPNPGFEQLNGCPAGPGELNLATPWTDAGNPTDLFSVCHVNSGTPSCNDVSVPLNFAGHTAAHSGSAYAGFYTKMPNANERTYLQAPINPFVAGQLYEVSAYFKRSTGSKYATNNLGITFSTNALSQAGNQFIPVTPQAVLPNVVADTGSWTRLTSYYVAFGGEKYITVGNFKNDGGTIAFNFINPSPPCVPINSSAFYYVDDISVTTITEQLSIIGDTVICIGQSTGLLGVTNTTGWWSTAALPADTIATTNNLLTITPATTTSYIWHSLQSSYMVTVSVVIPPILVLPNDSTVCEGVEIMLDATCAGCTYNWSTGANTPTITVSASGSYSLSVNNGGCYARDTFNLTVLASPEIEFMNGLAVCADNEVKVILDAGIAQTYTWSPGGDTTQSILVSEPGTYSVEVTYSNGCTRHAVTLIDENCPELIFIPGAFTPNNDGKNDLFYAEGTNVKNYKILIFNRWGKLIFETATLGISGGWNGKSEGKYAEQGVYTYQVSYDALQVNGRTKPVKKPGYFILLR